MRNYKYILLFVTSLAAAQPFASPSIIGAGATTTGGRGGTVIHVTNLNNSGAGSFREAVTASGTRTVVFDVSGTIHLTSLLTISNPNLTIAGQTAPEGGITIAGYSTRINADNIIIRHIRFKNANYTGEADVYAFNGIIVDKCTGLVLDHISFTFNDDQGLSMYAKTGDIKNVTVQRCLFSDNATGAIAGLRDVPTYPYDTGNMTFIYNLYVDQSHRTPNISGNLPYDIINNVYFNWMSRLSNVNHGNLATINFVGNHLRQGSYTTNGFANKISSGSSFNNMIYSAYNYHNTLYPTPQLNDQNLWQTFITDQPISSSVFTTTQHALVGRSYTILSASESRANVLADVGANKYLNADGTVGTYLDSFDAAKIANAGTYTSSNPYDKTYALPTLPTNSRDGSYDTDGDGIPNTYETARGWNPSVANNNTVTHPDGYTQLEEFLNLVDGVEEEPEPEPEPETGKVIKPSGGLIRTSSGAMRIISN